MGRSEQNSDCNKISFLRKGHAISWWIDRGNYGGRILPRSIREIHRIDDQDIYQKKDKTNATDIIQSAALKRLEASQSLRICKPWLEDRMMKE